MMISRSACLVKPRLEIPRGNYNFWFNTLVMISGGSMAIAPWAAPGQHPCRLRCVCGSAQRRHLHLPSFYIQHCSSCTPPGSSSFMASMLASQVLLAPCLARTWVRERDCLDTCALSWTLITHAQAPRGKSSTHGRGSRVPHCTDNKNNSMSLYTTLRPCAPP